MFISQYYNRHPVNLLFLSVLNPSTVSKHPASLHSFCNAVMCCFSTIWLEIRDLGVQQN